MKKCCYFKSTGTWDFGLMYVLVQPSYSDKIYDLTFLKKANSINSGSGLTLTTALSTTVPHCWTMDSFKFQHQDDSLSLPATFIIFFFLGEGWLCLVLSMVAALEILKGNFYLTGDKASPVQFPKHKSWKAIRSSAPPAVFCIKPPYICSKSTQTKVSGHLFICGRKYSQYNFRSTVLNELYILIFLMKLSISAAHRGAIQNRPPEACAVTAVTGSLEQSCSEIAFWKSLPRKLLKRKWHLWKSQCDRLILVHFKRTFSNKQEVYNLAVANGNRFSPLGSFSRCFPPFIEIS